MPDERERPEPPRESEPPAPPPAEAEPATPPPAAERKGPIEIKIEGSLVRCPYCHGDIKATTIDWVACSACLARHHRDCWQERGACSTCRGSTYLPADGARFYREGVGSAPALQKPAGLGKPLVRPIAAPARAQRTAAEQVLRDEARGMREVRTDPREADRPTTGRSLFSVFTCIFAVIGLLFVSGVLLAIFGLR